MVLGLWGLYEESRERNQASSQLIEMQEMESEGEDAKANSIDNELEESLVEQHRMESRRAYSLRIRKSSPMGNYHFE